MIKTAHDQIVLGREVSLWNISLFSVEVGMVWIQCLSLRNLFIFSVEKDKPHFDPDWPQETKDYLLEKLRLCSVVCVQAIYTYTASCVHSRWRTNECNINTTSGAEDKLLWFKQKISDIKVCLQPK